MVRTCLLVAALWLLGTFTIMTAPLAAQAISGVLVEAETGAPVEGASVILLSCDGEQLAWRLTNAAGRFDFRMEAPGTYLLQADRIGHARALSDPIPIDRGVTVEYRLEAPLEAIMLAGISVESSRRCEVRPEQGMPTATVWEEARKALEVTSRTSRLGVYSYVMRLYERELDARGREVGSEQNRVLRGQTRSSPFTSQAVEDLLEEGFVRPDGDGSMYNAPDADVLLSDLFLDTHCMSLAEGDDEAEGLLGLSFEPIEDRGVPDVSGVLWVDPEDGELQWLDYRYEFLDVPNSERLGGKVQFHRLPNGRWIVRDWYIRMPRLQATVERGRRGPTRLVGIREEGGLVVRINDERGAVVLEVVQPEGSNPERDGVFVLDEGTGVQTDDDGRVRITSLADGNYSLREFDPEVECVLGDLTVFGGILTGFALTEAGVPAPGALIKVAYPDVTARLGYLRRFDLDLTTTALSDDGFFLVCGLPRDRQVEVTVEWNGMRSTTERFYLLRTQRVSRRDITIGRGR
jgi:hypothetical protein